jgi:hypothetical protein
MISVMVANSSSDYLWLLKYQHLISKLIMKKTASNLPVRICGPQQHDHAKPYLQNNRDANLKQFVTQ